MPIYTYRCKCGHQEDAFRKIATRHDGPHHCGEQMQMRIMPTMIQTDISTYMSAAVDKETGKRVVINSRKQHREFLARNDYVEVGNEFKMPKREVCTEPEAPTFDAEEMKKQGWIEEDL